ncbi:MAG: hypothetical protein QOJ64_3138, partial [Acidobacteriota bacterium]|nr:hypothetical protein [Acidobacteriota bacterium]
CSEERLSVVGIELTDEPLCCASDCANAKSRPAARMRNSPAAIGRSIELIFRKFIILQTRTTKAQRHGADSDRLQPTFLALSSIASLCLGVSMVHASLFRKQPEQRCGCGRRLSFGPSKHPANGCEHPPKNMTLAQVIEERIEDGHGQKRQQ